MIVRYLLAPEAAFDLVGIWSYIRKQSGIEVADHVESIILDKVAFLRETQALGIGAGT
jgi:plasmid stabilization system protein ParE